MKAIHLVGFSFLTTFLLAGVASANPSAVGQYGGTTSDIALPTFATFNSSARGIISKIEVVGFQSLCVSTLPGLGVQPAEVRSTNITRRETPSLRLRANGTFAGSFVLNDPGRMDFRNAEVRVTGRLSGRRGSITFTLTMNESYSDGSSQVCGGSIRVPVRLAQRR